MGSEEYDSASAIENMETKLAAESIGISGMADWIEDFRDKNGRQSGIVIVTSGGDSCGMNAAIRSAARVAILCGARVFGSHRGYDGLIDGNIEEIGWDCVSKQSRTGGTMLMTARSPRFRTKDGRRSAAHSLIRRGIGAMVVIGGDGSLRGAMKLQREFPAHRASYCEGAGSSSAAAPAVLSVVGIPGTIDNDVYGSETSLGADSALQRILGVANRLYSNMRSSRRVFVLETMGNTCGWLATAAAFALDADYVLVPEKRYAGSWREELAETVGLSWANHKEDILVLLCENTRDASGKRITLQDVAGALSAYHVRTHRIGHVQRGGAPSARDSVIGTLAGVCAIKIILERSASTAGGQPCAKMIAVCGDELKAVDLEACVDGTRLTRKMVKRGGDALALRPELFRSMLSNLEGHRKRKLGDSSSAAGDTERARVGIVNSGDRTAGMNACLHMLVQEGLCSGLQMLYFSGGPAAMDQISEAAPHQFRRDSGGGGVAIGTSKSAGVDAAHIAEQMQKHRLDWLVMIGDWANLELARRVQNVILVPTESRRILPLRAFGPNEMCLGFDSSLNSVVKALTICRDSIEHLEKTALVVEVASSKQCVMAALASGAFATICDITGNAGGEEKEEALERLVRRLNDHFSAPNSAPAIILRSADVWGDLDTSRLAKTLAQRSGLSVQYCVLGPLGDGFVPSPVDQMTAGLAAFEVVKSIREGRGSGAVGLVAGMVTFVHADEMRPEAQGGESGRKLAEMLEICQMLEKRPANSRRVIEKRNEVGC
ncbi:6-phosphofructokinase 1 [Pancytospora philotis]|nr:6-phosphofructokinase 1 [Pancytospora philotis]